MNESTFLTLETFPSAAAMRQDRPVRVLTTGLLVVVPVLFNVGFTLLSARFDYPKVLRQPPGDVLLRFHASQAALLPGWYLLLIAAALLVPLAVMTAHRCVPLGVWRTLAAALGTAAGVVQAIGLARWVFLVPSLAASYANAANASEQFALRTVFTAFHQWGGAGVGEHLGYLFTGLWTLIVAGSLWKAGRIARLLSAVGIASASAILAGLLEPFHAAWAAPLNTVGYLVLSLWLIALGVHLARTRP